MNNCLIEKLKGSVNNPNLPLFDTVIYHLNPSSGRRVFTFLSESPLIVSLKNGTFLDGTNSKQVSANVETVLYSDTTVTDEISVFGKSFLAKCTLSGATSIRRMEQSDYIGGSVADADYIWLDPLKNSDLGTLPNNLRVRNLDNCKGDVTGKVLHVEFKCDGVNDMTGTLAGIKDMTDFYLDNTQIGFNLSLFSDASNSAITRIYMPNNPNIVGSATMFINGFSSLTTLNLTGCTGITDRTAETKAAIEAAHPGITVTW